jgi:polar amino acid transport system substrate-binding protein
MRKFSIACPWRCTLWRARVCQPLPAKNPCAARLDSVVNSRSPKAELAGKTWAELNDPAFTIAVDLGSSQDQITKAYLPNANILRFKTRDEAILAVTTGKADAIINTVFNGMVMTKKNPAVGAVHVPTPILSSPSVIGMNYATDPVFKSFVSAWADYNRRVGNNQTWILKGLEPFDIGLKDLPAGFDING